MAEGRCRDEYTREAVENRHTYNNSVHNDHSTGSQTHFHGTSGQAEYTTQSVPVRHYPVRFASIDEQGRPNVEKILELLYSRGLKGQGRYRDGEEKAERDRVRKNQNRSQSSYSEHSLRSPHTRSTPVGRTTRREEEDRPGPGITDIVDQLSDLFLEKQRRYRELEVSPSARDRAQKNWEEPQLKISAEMAATRHAPVANDDEQDANGQHLADDGVDSDDINQFFVQLLEQAHHRELEAENAKDQILPEGNSSGGSAPSERHTAASSPRADGQGTFICDLASDRLTTASSEAIYAALENMDRETREEIEQLLSRLVEQKGRYKQALKEENKSQPVSPDMSDERRQHGFPAMHREVVDENASRAIQSEAWNLQNSERSQSVAPTPPAGYYVAPETSFVSMTMPKAMPRHKSKNPFVMPSDDAMLEEGSSESRVHEN